MHYLWLEKESAFLDLLLQRSRGKNDLVYRGKAAQAFDRRERYDVIEAKRINNLVFFV